MDAGISLYILSRDMVEYLYQNFMPINTHLCSISTNEGSSFAQT